jgi:hypothetical protein
MSPRSDDDRHLTSLLQALPVPEPSVELLTGARRRYRAAIEARDRRHVLTGLLAALVGLAVTATLLGSAVEPTALAGGCARAAAHLDVRNAGLRRGHAVAGPHRSVAVAGADEISRALDRTPERKGDRT